MKKPAILLAVIVLPIILPMQAGCQRLKIQPVYEKYKTTTESWFPAEVWMAMSFDVQLDNEVISCSASTHKHWILTGPGATGEALLEAEAGWGIQWELIYGMDRVIVRISDDPGNTNDPRLMTITSKKDTFYMHNLEPDANSIWGLSTQDDDPWTEAVFIAKGSSGGGNWNAASDEAGKSAKKKKAKRESGPEWAFDPFPETLDGRYRFAFIFASILAMNVRYHISLQTD